MPPLTISTILENINNQLVCIKNLTDYKAEPIQSKDLATKLFNYTISLLKEICQTLHKARNIENKMNRETILINESTNDTVILLTI